MKKDKKKKQNVLKYIIDRWILFVFAGIIIYFLVGIVLSGIVKNYLLNNDSAIINAVIVDEKNYWGNSPVSHRFSYSYEFIVEGKHFRKDSRNEKLKIGDSVLIEYVPILPNYSRLKENK